ncbi:type 4 pilus major pilin [Escherichia coli]|uniref:type 4 pilus major pilin n=1 Tax=Escherichia coli TaxID=562 RepID=UPI002258ECD6|nr:type 4 pilus major pilin [Escherichia coli]MCX3738024.1 pilus assembly protein [Escherichia coli]HCJ6139639.1 pilus assembly protein [Escherichia coli]
MNIFTKKVFDKKAEKRKSPLLLQKGLSLIEASMVLALSAIVVSGVMYYYQAASDNNKTQTTVSEVMSIVSAINGLYIGSSGYKDLKESVIYNTSAVPENYKGSQGKIMHPFGGEINIGPTANDSKYYIVLRNVPQGPCVNLASMNFGTSLAGAGVGAAAVAAAQKGTPTGNDLMNTALTPAQASSKCNNTTGSNDIAFLLK